MIINIRQKYNQKITKPNKYKMREREHKNNAITISKNKTKRKI
jgi:hypothetical protein